MDRLLEKYEGLQLKLQTVMNDFRTAENKLTSFTDVEENQRAARIEHYQEQLEKIEEYRVKIDRYRQIAEKHMESKNLLATEGMDDIVGQPRELNFKHMHDWATYIDPTSSDDPYAQRIYVMAMCNLIYLDNKQKQFEGRINELESGKTIDADAEAEIRSAKNKALKETEKIIQSQEFTDFCEELKQRSALYQDCRKIGELQGKEYEGLLSFSAFRKPMPVFDEVKPELKKLLDTCYDAESNAIEIPAEIELQNEYLISCITNVGKEKKLYRSLQNYLYQRIAVAEPGKLKICTFDAIHYNNSSLGMLKELEETSLIANVPSDEDQMIDQLKEVISDFIDIDEKLGMADSVSDYNLSKEAKDQIVRRIILFIGYPTQFSAEALNLINRIILNHEHYGVSVITVDTQFNQKKMVGEKDITETAVSGLIQLKLSEQTEMISEDHKDEFECRLYEMKSNLPQAFVQYAEDHDLKENTLGNVYIRRVGIENDVLSTYTRGKKTIRLPYGVDGADEIHSVAFSNENFATFLMGASGSGKSTLLHTLITGILKDYHPDDVELWLADFKMSEFAQYMNPLPPHVKYILLDESPELVYDLIDKLNDQMMERQRYFMVHRNIKNVEDVPKDVYMPVIFVILDEFSIMSQAIAEAEEYKLKLQNLLAKGRALGIKFLFSSQTFTKGIQGLTSTAKDQIQSRIAMKNSKTEIEETLELSSAQKTEKVRNWIDALPPHYALYKYREGDSIQLRRMKVLYFEGKGTETYKPQRDLIDSMNSVMQKVSQYKPENTKYYLDKHPVIVDGNSYTAFDQQAIGTMLEQYRQDHKDEYSPEDTLIILGTPRRMDTFKVSAFTSESRENMLMIARSSDQMQNAANLLTIMKCFSIQGRNVEIWTYSRNRLYRAFKDTHWNTFTIRESIEDITEAIHRVKVRIDSRMQGNDLFVLLGFERVISDFELTAGTPETKAVYQSNQNAAVSNQQEIDEQIKLQKWAMRRSELKKQFTSEGRTNEEIDQLLKNEKKVFLQGFKLSSAAAVVKAPIQTEKTKEKPVNPAEELQTLIRQGSRYGYHFIIAANSLVDFKQSGLKLDYFRHRVSCQVSKEDSLEIFGRRQAAGELPEHVYAYDNGTDRYSYRPYLHSGLNWDGWYVSDDSNEVINIFDRIEG